METQKQLILNALLKGQMLTKLDMLRRFGIMCSSQRISELRQDGYDIQHIMCRNQKTKKQFAKYFLVKNGVRRKF